MIDFKQLLSTIFFLHCCCAILGGQNIHHPISVEAKGLTYEIPVNSETAILGYSFTWEGPEENFKIRFSKDEKKWTLWNNVTVNQHFKDGHKSILDFVDPGFKFFQMDFNSKSIQNLITHFHLPEKTKIQAVEYKSTISLRSEECACMQPQFLNREGWCPAGNCPPDATPEATAITHLIVHHSAGTNVANDWAAIVRAIWSDHVNVNRWDDIGYNWLIDPDGKLYEGRGYQTRGAHFCSKNSNTAGICILGNFQNRPPSPEAVEALKNFLTWQSCDAEINPLIESELGASNEVFEHISGHRDGCSTVCPGNNFIQCWQKFD